MKKNLLVFLLLLVGNQIMAQNFIQMPLPPQFTTFSGNVRGYWFTSPTCFTITGLEVPTDASSGLQNIAVVRLDSFPLTYPATTNSFSLLFLTQNDTATGMIPVSIEVNVGSEWNFRKSGEQQFL
ncbi:MAG: hypothetical protein IPO63_17715 [Bacteroidetes bacterium]|nr:hypothetical protein [Bacteroidota bacterium]